MPLAIVGEAPSSSGPGQAFSGSAANRLTRLMGVEDYKALWAVCHLENLLTEPTYDGWMKEAETQAKISLDVMLFLNKNTQVIACGNGVYRAFTHRNGKYFKGVSLKAKAYPTRRVDIWCFPHPSGASPFWKEPENFKQAAQFIGSIRDRAARLDAQ